MIVDNNLKHAVESAERLTHIRPSLLNNNALQIEISNTAYFVAKRLRECPPTETPWDIIIADVYMQVPSDHLRQEIPKEDAVGDRCSYHDHEWLFWKYEYTWNSDSAGQIEHGGFHIAQEIKELKNQGKDLGNLKLVLVSGRLVLKDRRKLEQYPSSERNWFAYYDKDNWDEPPEWPRSQNKPDIFKWALVQAIAERASELWGDVVFQSVPGAEDYINASRSAGMEEVVIEGRRLGNDTKVGTILITGETGTGKSVIARMIHEVRMTEIRASRKFVTIDCAEASDPTFEGRLLGFTAGGSKSALNTGLVDEAAGGTLFLKNIGRLPPYLQSKLFSLLKEKRFRRIRGTKELGFQAELVICSSSRNPEEMLKNSNGSLFHEDLYYLIKNDRIDIPPLREREDDIVPLAELAIQRSGGEIHLTDEARLWLRARLWPGNVLELSNTVVSAARNCISSELTDKDLHNSALPNAYEAYQQFLGKLDNLNIATLIAKRESNYLEFKSSARWDFKENKQNKAIEDMVVKTIAAFLNTDGGNLLIGVDDEHNVLGLEYDYKLFGKKDPRDAYENFLTTLLLNNFGKGCSVLISISIEELAGKDLARVVAKPSPKPVFVKDNKGEHLYIRAGNTTRSLTMREALDYCKVHWRT
jgi:DNA-binding NtrC family response regulator